MIAIKPKTGCPKWIRTVPNKNIGYKKIPKNANTINIKVVMLF